MRSLKWILGCGLGLVLVLPIAAQDGGKVLLKGARIIPVSGPEIASGSILIEYGKIAAVGADVAAPFDARVIDCTGKVVMPGMIEALTARGLDYANETMDIGVFMQAADAVDPSDKFFEEALRQGVTSVHVCQGENTVMSGVSRVVRPIGLTVQEMTVRAEGGVRLMFGAKQGYDRSVQLAVLREAFDDLDRYLEKLAEQLYEEDVKKKGQVVTVPPAEARKLGKDMITLAKVDDMHRNLLRLRQGRLDVYATCPKAMDVKVAIDFAKEEGFFDRLTFVIGAECHKAAAALKEAGRPVVVPWRQMIATERDRMTFEDVETFVPKVLADKKIAFALSDAPQPWYEAARCVRNGVPRAAALAAVTAHAATAIGLESRLGTLEPGKDGNVIVLSGDPLDSMTWVESVFIEGVQVYERAKDKRLRDLLTGAFATAEAERKAAAEKKPATAATTQPAAPSTQPASAPAASQPAGEPKKD
jgi:imidazolonepropionase-like amidohydrolase